MELLAKTQEQKAHIEKLLGIADDEYFDILDDKVYYEGGISFEQMATVVDYLRGAIATKKDELFESCWIAYRRKGSKKKSKDYWNKLNIEERQKVLTHIRFYVATREVVYQKDFERYLRDKTFLDVIYKGNEVVFDPTIKSGNNEEEYRPQIGGKIIFDEKSGSYVYIGMFAGVIPDGYDDKARPDGATILLNNNRGRISWNKGLGKWEK